MAEGLDLTDIAHALLKLLVSATKIAVYIIGALAEALWAIANQLMSSQQTMPMPSVTQEREPAPPTTANEQSTQRNHSAETTEMPPPEAEGEGQPKTDPFWNITTLPTSRYPDIPVEQHAAKYSPDYETLAALDSNKIFPPKE